MFYYINGIIERYYTNLSVAILCSLDYLECGRSVVA